MKHIIILLFIINLSSCSYLAYNDITHNSDYVFNSKIKDLGECAIYFDSYTATETKFIFLDKQGKLAGEAPLTTEYVIRKNPNKRIYK